MKVNRIFTFSIDDVRHGADVDIVYHVDDSYAQDADGNRRSAEFVIDNISINCVMIDGYSISITKEIQDHINTIVPELF